MPQESVRGLTGGQMSERRFVEFGISSILWCLILMIILIEIKSELNSISDSLKILSSPPEAVNLEQKSAKGN